ncbi:MAG: SH3 domain-containing protein [Sphingorhabdus sp.]
MVGFEGRAGDWINQIRILCAPLTGQHSIGAVQPIGDFSGGRAGGNPERETCPSNSVMSQISFLLTADKRKVSSIKFDCTRQDGAVEQKFFEGAGGAPGECNKFMSGCDPDEFAHRIQMCSQESLVGLRINSGQDVNAIGLLCDRRDPPRAATPPVAQPSPRPVRQTGRPRVAPVAAPAPQPNAAAMRIVDVKLDVDVYAAPGGNGQASGQLAAGTANVELVQPCRNNWCQVRWAGQEGWVYSGPDYNSLGQ